MIFKSIMYPAIIYMCTFTYQTTMLSVRHKAKAKIDRPIVQQFLGVIGYIKYHDLHNY